MITSPRASCTAASVASVPKSSAQKIQSDPSSLGVAVDLGAAAGDFLVGFFPA